MNVFRNRERITKPYVNRCEWNPMFKCAAWHPPQEGDCRNEATAMVKILGETYRVCDECAKGRRRVKFSR